MRSGLNVGWRSVETKAGASLTDSNSGADANDIVEVNGTLAPEVSSATVGSPNFRIPSDFYLHHIRGEKNEDRSVIEPEMPADV